ncbi:hypothetical protein [Microcoleus sp. B4-D1]|uniref:hypothetical protein n=1 Tax=Microcoleus sp. B4-D1 TaxID=2818666 RepID=UPI002FD5AB52
MKKLLAIALTSILLLMATDANAVVCKKITDGKPGCDLLGGTWDSQNNCCGL